MEKEIGVLVVGDLAMTNSFTNRRLVDDSVNELFQKVDCRIVNLEAPVTDCSFKITKTGPHLKADRESTRALLRNLNVDVLTLANNHILDYGEQGVFDTLEFCHKNNMKTVGAGKNIAMAIETLYLEVRERKIAIVNFAENEWASATSKSAGANPMNTIDNVEQIKNAKRNADFVFVIIHGGHEYYNLPNPRMQKQYRFYAELGADIIIGHHPHCISGYEIYKGVPIYYSLGNFLFTRNSSFEDWYLGLALEIRMHGKEFTMKLHPVQQNKQSFKLTLLQGEKKDQVLRRVDEYSSIIHKPDILLSEWEKFIESKYEAYLGYWSSLSFVGNRYLRAVFNRMGVKMYSKRALKLFFNLMRCEAHRDLSLEVIKKYLNR